ncbi:LacI family DNA-binding transcriptional regulator [Agromyces albus]|uniref:LacI family DNA-binding transcriptional regulator n=1 Tax=Agromyces albus TaxID=205332 RepID=UPI0027806076|nr:LacI family DNA-binding transcriptional regulator [Agromyces albus]MDQ0577409.1 DNA-binding LacI/PurR family transcriptional regulator [Agromyces albus]
MTVADEATDAGQPRRRSPSMADVAREAGVSGQTVSRVSTGRPNVDEDTRNRVLAAMRKLGYRPNSAARALRSGHFRNLGVIMFTLSSFGNMRTLDSIAVAAAAAGYSITLIPVQHPTQGEVTVAFSRLSEQAVDGVMIIIEAHALDEADIELPPGLPVVVVDSSARYQYPVVDTDQAEGARLATEHLLDLGHDTVWHISGPVHSYSAERRRESWAETLATHGRTVPDVIVGDWSSEAGYRAGLELASRPEVTAIFAANDQMALGVLRALHERGRAVPADVSVVGFDDMEESKSFWPPLTTVHQSFEEVGRHTVSQLIEEIEGAPPSSVSVLVPTELVVRSSSGPAPRHPTADA